MSFNFLKQVSKKELKAQLDIQMQNNKILREALRMEQQDNKANQLEIKKLKDKIEKLKENVREAYNEKEGK
jgi:hypothetical protein